MSDLVRTPAEIDQSTREDLIWSAEELARRTEFPDADVRAWALGKLVRLNPAAADACAMRAVGDSDPQVWAEALKVFARTPADLRGPEKTGAVVRCLAEFPRSPRLREAAIRLLARLPGPEADAELERTIRTGSEMEQALAAGSLADRDPAKARVLLTPLIPAAGAADSAVSFVSALISAAGAAAIESLGDPISRIDRQDLREGLMVQLAFHGGAEDALLMLRAREGSMEEALVCLDGDLKVLKRIGDPNWSALEGDVRSAAWKRVVERASRLAEACGSAADAFFREYLERDRAALRALEHRDRPGESEASAAVALAWAAHRILALEESLRSDAAPDRLVRLHGAVSSAFKPVVRERIERHRAGEGLDRIRDAVLEELRPETPAVRRWGALELAENLEGLACGRAILFSLTKDLPPAARDTAVRALSSPSGELRELASEFLGRGDESRDAELLFALDDQPCRWAARAVLDRLAALLRRPMPNLVWECLEELGDPAVLPALVEEWRPGEPLLAGAIDFLARVKGDAEIPPEIRREVEAFRKREDEKRRRLAGAKTPREALDRLSSEPIDLLLRCRRCGRTYGYEVGSVLIDPDAFRDSKNVEEGILLSRIIACKKCGAEDDYEWDPLSLAGLLARMDCLKSKGKPADESSPIRFGKATLWDGTVVRRPSHALRRLRQAAEAEPRNAEARRRLGNFCRRYGLLEEAERAYRDAVERDPKEAESLFNLLTLNAEANRGEETARLIRRVIEALPGSKASPEIRLGIARETLGYLRGLLDVTKEPLSIHAAWFAGESKGEAIVSLSGIDLRRFRRWDALAEFLASEPVRQVTLSPEVIDKEDHPTILDELLEDWDRGKRSPRRPAPIVRPSGMGPAEFMGVPGRPARVGRNDPCPCGSGKKHKKCCGRG